MVAVNTNKEAPNAKSSGHKCLSPAVFFNVWYSRHLLKGAAVNLIVSTGT